MVWCRMVLASAGLVYIYNRRMTSEYRSIEVNIYKQVCLNDVSMMFRNLSFKIKLPDGVPTSWL